MNIEIGQTEIKFGKKSIKLSQEEMLELATKLDQALGRTQTQQFIAIQQTPQIVYVDRPQPLPWWQSPPVIWGTTTSGMGSQNISAYNSPTGTLTY
jgi:hypothetical protein